MAKNRNNPNKGFLKQIATVNTVKPSPVPQAFQWEKPINPNQKRMSLGVPKDGEKLKKPDKEIKSTFVKESQSFIQERRDKENKK